MLSKKRKYKLTATCNKCGYQITEDVEVEPDKLSGAKAQFHKQVGSIHRQHPDLDSFDVKDRLM